MKHSRGAVAAFVALVMLVVAGSAQAATYTVTSTSDPTVSACSGTVCPSLRDAVVAADNAGGATTISLGSGTFTLTIPGESGDSNDPEVGDLDINNDASITITGAGAGSTIIDASNIDRAFAVHPGASLSLSDVTIEGGQTGSSSPAEYSFNAGLGGAIYNGGALTLNNCIVGGNTASDGGGAIASYSTATSTTITNSTLSGNAAENGGGAVYVEGGTASLSSDTLNDNNATGPGGALYAEESSPTSAGVSVSGSTLSGNSTGAPGGAIYLQDVGPSSVTDSVLDGNQTTAPGGAIDASDSGELTVSGSTFDDDAAGTAPGGAIDTSDSNLSLSASELSDDSAGLGGAVYLDGTSNTAQQSITSSTFSANRADSSQGGAIYSSEGDLTISLSTLDGNSSTQSGGGFYDESDGGLSMTNDTIAGNRSYEGGGLFFGEQVEGGTGLLNDTIVDNSAYQGGGIWQPNDAGAIENTIVAQNTGSVQSPYGGGDCYYPADYSSTDSDKGHNLDDDGSCFGGSSPFASGDKSDVPIALDSLASNGGPEETVALPAGSAAIGAADGADCPITDERGVARTASSCDAGAFQTAAADLALSVSAPSKVVSGAGIEYQFTVTNNGPAPALGVTFDDTIPGGATYFAATSSQGTCSGTGTVECSLGTMNSSSTGGSQPVTITIYVIAGSAGSVRNTASVGGTTTDPNATNNTASATTTVSSATSTARIAPLVFTSTASKIRTTSAGLGGLINPAGLSTTYYVQYGTSKRYGKTTKSATLSAGTKSRSVSITVKGLKKKTRYYFRLVARNAAGTTDGQAESFKTS